MIKFIFKYLNEYNLEFLLIVFCAITTSATDLAMPYISAKFIDEVLITNNHEGLYFFIAILLGMNVLSVLSNWFFIVRSTIMRAKLTKDISEDLMRHIQRLESKFLNETDMIYLSKRISKDSDDLLAFVLGSAIDISIQSVMLLMAIFLLQSIGIKWLIILLIVAVIHAGIFGLLRKKLFQYSKEVRETESRYFTSFSDNFLYVQSIKLHSLYEEFLITFRQSFKKLFDAIIKETKVRFWFAYGKNNETKIFTVLIFLLGGLDVLDDTLSIGNFVALNGYYLLAMQGIAYFMSIGQSYQNALAAYIRIMEIKNLPTETNGAKILDQINSIEICNINFKFNEHKILTDFNQHFERGKIYCIIGKNGAGKSTLINLICYMIHPHNGTILFNDIPITEVDMIHARKNLISVVEQKNFLKNDNLSGGERRKVSINTALNKSADILIMDEPDNDLDTNAIANLTEKIVNDKTKRITIIISHDERLINIADEIIHL